MVIEIMPPSSEILGLHGELCERLAGHSVMLIVLGPHGGVTPPKLSMLLNDKVAFEVFLQAMIMQHEKFIKGIEPSNEPKH